MPRIQASETAVIAAPAQIVYDIIADYRDGHPRILPPEYFGGLAVERGGIGAGTRIRFEMKAFGRTTISTAEITEPHPGRELRETLDSGIITTFRLDPRDTGSTAVTIETVYDKPGLQGFVESLLAPRYLRRVYSAELARLDREAVRRLQNPS